MSLNRTHALTLTAVGLAVLGFAGYQFLRPGNTGASDSSLTLSAGDTPEERDPQAQPEAAENLFTQGLRTESPRPTTADEDPQAATPASIHGRVVDAAGRPVPQVAVSFFVRPRAFDQMGPGGGGPGGGPGFGRNFDPRDFQPRKQGNDVRTGADGKFEFKGRDYRRQGFAVVAQLERNAPAIAIRNQAPVGDGVDLGDLMLREGSTLAGLVVEDTGAAVPEATITLRNEERGGGPGMFRGGGLDRVALLEAILPPIKTAGSGVFEVRNLPEGAYRVAVHAARMLPVESEPVRVDPGQRADAGTLKMTRGVDLAGVVLDPAGAPVAAADVSVNQGGGGPPWMRMDENTRTKSDAQGRFELHGLPRQPVGVRAHKDGLRDHQVDNVTPGTGDLVTVQLKAPLSIAGIVVDAQGQPVELYAARARRVWTADDAGQMNFRGGPGNAGDAQNNNRRRGGQPGADQAGAANNMGRGPGRRGGRMNQPGATGKPEKHADGRFLLTDLDPGTYAVDVSSPEHMNAASAEVKVVDGQTAPPTVQVVLNRGCAIAGVCVDLTTGEPIVGAELGLVWIDPEDQGGNNANNGMGGGPGGRGNRGGRMGQLFEMVTGFGGRPMAAQATVKSDGQGRFAFAHQRPGRYLVQASGADHANSKSPEFDVAEGKDMANLRVAMARGATVTGRVLGLKTKDASAAVVSCAGPMRREVPTALDGTYKLEHLEPGEYMVRARLAESDNMLQMRDLLRMINSQGGRDASLTLQEGQTVTLDLELMESHMAAVEGSVLRNGAPATGHDVSLRPLDLNLAMLGNNDQGGGGGPFGGGPFGGGPDAIAGMASGMLRSAVTSDGRFRIDSVPEGRYQIEVRRGGNNGGGGRGGRGGFGGGGGSRVYRREVTVVRGQPLNVSITFAVGELSGALTAAEGNAQVGRARAFLLPADEARGRNPDELSQGSNGFNVQVDRDNKLTARDLPAGDYVLVVQAQGRKRSVQNVLVPAAGTVPVTVLMEKDPQTQPGDGAAAPTDANGPQPGGRRGRGQGGPGGGGPGGRGNRGGGNNNGGNNNGQGRGGD